jgi:amino acid transporter
VIAVGLQAPVIMILAFIPMYCVAVGYRELNEAEPDAGTTFTWATRTFGPRTGWMGGWAIVAADVVVMANLAAIAGSYFFLLFNADGVAGQLFWPTVVGVGWIVLMTWICYIGIEISARVQYALLGIELTILALFSVVALIRVYAGHAVKGVSLHPALSWFNPFDISSRSALATGCCWRSSSTGASTPPCRSTRRRRTHVGRPARRRSPPRSCCSLSTSW